MEETEKILLRAAVHGDRLARDMLTDRAADLGKTPADFAPEALKMLKDKIRGVTIIARPFMQRGGHPFPDAPWISIPEKILQEISEDCLLQALKIYLNGQACPPMAYVARMIYNHALFCAVLFENGQARRLAVWMRARRKLTPAAIAEGAYFPGLFQRRPRNLLEAENRLLMVLRHIRVCDAE